MGLFRVAPFFIVDVGIDQGGAATPPTSKIEMDSPRLFKKMGVTKALHGRYSRQVVGEEGNNMKLSKLFLCLIWIFFRQL